MVTVNINHVKNCAFCKFWWDPSCKYIAPKAGDAWLYDNHAKCHCIIKGFEWSASSTCPKFTCKIELR